MEAAPGTSPALSSTIATRVLPRYIAALEPVRATEAPAGAAVTVTLVRWPFT